MKNIASKILAVWLALGGVCLHGQAPAAAATPAEPFGPGLDIGELAKLSDISDLIKQHYRQADRLTSKSMCEAAISGLMGSLDPYCHYYTPEEWAQEKEGQLFGSGVVLDLKKPGEAARILYVIPFGPADFKGLKTDDRIVKVDGADARALKDLQAVGAKLRGDGRQVTVEVERLDASGRNPSPLTVTLTRRMVKSENIFSRMLPGSVGYLYFHGFKNDSAREALAAIRALKARGANSLIVDVRGNPGGGLDECKDLTAAFLRQGQEIVTLKRKDGSSTLKAETDGVFKDLPLKVLVDGRSASASEVFAAALQAHKRAAVVGPGRTYGKGSSQGIFPQKDGSAIVITVQHWETPDRRSIEKDPLTGVGGVTPDVLVSVDPETEVKALQGVLAQLHTGLKSAAASSDPVLERALQP